MPSTSAQLQAPFCDSLPANQKLVADVLGHNADFKLFPFTLYEAEQLEGCFCFLDGMVDITLLETAIKSITEYSDDLVKAGTPTSDLASRVKAHFVMNEQADKVQDAVQGLLKGEALIMVGGEVFRVAIAGWKERSIDTPATENVVRGPRDGFVENIKVNISLVRRRIQDPSLHVELLRIGEKSRTEVNIVYMDGIVKPKLVDEVRRRLQDIRIDAILESGYIEELIQDAPYSPFRTVLATERPDRIAGNLLEGRVAIFVDNTPFVLIVPTFFWDFIRAPDDYYTSMWNASFLRGVRFCALVLSFTLSSIYVMLVSFHQEMIPGGLALTIASGRDVVPFPVLIEALLMELVFELMREAGLRMPKPIGQAVSIVGSLVIGQAAVQAGFVSPFMVIVVALTGISSFAIPNYDMAFSIRLFRFPLIIASGVLGLLGFSVVFYTILLHIFSLRSFGESYFAPASPFQPSDQKDLLIRKPWWSMRKRPVLAKGNQQREGENLLPQPPSVPDQTRPRKGTSPWTLLKRKRG